MKAKKTHLINNKKVIVNAQQVNQYGEHGWELVSVFTTAGAAISGLTPIGGITNGVFAMFKRKYSQN